MICRKKKAVHKATSTDDKRLQTTLKRLGVNTIPGIEVWYLRMEMMLAGTDIYCVCEYSDSDKSELDSPWIDLAALLCKEKGDWSEVLQKNF